MRRITCALLAAVLGMAACGDDDDVANPMAGANDTDLRIRLVAQDWHDTEDNTLTFSDDGTWRSVSEFGRTVDQGSWQLEGGVLTLTSWEDDSVTSGPVSAAEGRMAWETEERGTIYWYDEEQ